MDATTALTVGLYEKPHVSENETWGTRLVAVLDKYSHSLQLGAHRSPSRARSFAA